MTCLNRCRKLLGLSRPITMKNRILFSFLSCAASLVMTILLALVLAADVSAAESKRLLIVGQGPDGHPPATHEFMAGANVLTELLKPHKELQTTVVNAD